MTDDAKQEREAVLPPCPFCGAHPHHGLSKVMYDGLHGDPYQRFQVWCPNGHAKVDKVNREQAFAAWKACQPKTDTLHEQLLQECLVKLRDVQGTEAPKQYACNLIKRIERVLQGQSK
jgi:hypothetical protein